MAFAFAKSPPSDFLMAHSTLHRKRTPQPPPVSSDHSTYSPLKKMQLLMGLHFNPWQCSPSRSATPYIEVSEKLRSIF